MKKIFARAAANNWNRKIVNRFTRDFVERFCDDQGSVNRVKLVESVSGNYDLDGYLP